MNAPYEQVTFLLRSMVFFITILNMLIIKCAEYFK